jgi:ABC-2 type transport system ATP-binding protein
VDLTIRAGSVYGLLGPNGAGKTTTIRILTTLLKPTSGRALVLGRDVVTEAAMVRQTVSLTGQYASVDEDLTGVENLVLVARLLGLSWGDARRRATELLAAFDLSDAAGRQVRTYSGGMRRRIDIAASLVTHPEILFLDEPTSGLDPRSRNQVWDLVRQIAGEGTTVLLTTQYLEEADRLAERLAVIDHGKVIAEGTSRDLKSSVGSSALHLQLVKPDQRAEAQVVVTRLLADCLLPATDPGSFAVKVPDARVAAEVLAALSRANIPFTNFALGAPSLDDVFFALTGRPAENKDGETGKEAAR